MIGQVEALSDPTPRLYSCFCGKHFTTYPGIYLHLKSKHNHLFAIYKQLKITKLFKKQKTLNGNDLYVLEKVDETTAHQPIVPHPKIKEFKERSHPRSNRPSQNCQPANSNANNPCTNQFHPPFAPPYPMMHPQSMFPPPFMLPPPTSFYESARLDAGDKARQFPQVGYPFNMTPPMQQKNLRSLMEQYLLTVSQPLPISQVQQALLNLIHQIDTHYSQIQNPRVREGLFLSYCSTFGPDFAGPLICRYGEGQGRSESQRLVLRELIQWLQRNGHILFPPQTSEQQYRRIEIVEVLDDENEEKNGDDQGQVKGVRDQPVKPFCSDHEDCIEVVLSESFEKEALEEEMKMREGQLGSVPESQLPVIRSQKEKRYSGVGQVLQEAVSDSPK